MTDPQTPADSDTTSEPVNLDVNEANEASSDEQPATTAGEEDHRDPDEYRGDEADAPADTGKPAQDN
jgi:hypothetical protein